MNPRRLLKLSLLGIIIAGAQSKAGDIPALKYSSGALLALGMAKMAHQIYTKDYSWLAWAKTGGLVGTGLLSWIIGNSNFQESLAQSTEEPFQPTRTLKRGNGAFDPLMDIAIAAEIRYEMINHGECDFYALDHSEDENEILSRLNNVDFRDEYLRLLKKDIAKNKRLKYIKQHLYVLVKFSDAHDTLREILKSYATFENCKEASQGLQMDGGDAIIINYLPAERYEQFLKEALEKKHHDFADQLKQHGEIKMKNRKFDEQLAQGKIGDSFRQASEFLVNGTAHMQEKYFKFYATLHVTEIL